MVAGEGLTTLAPSPVHSVHCPHSTVSSQSHSVLLSLGDPKDGSTVDYREDNHDGDNQNTENQERLKKTTKEMIQKS